MKAQKRKPTKRSVSVKELSDICVPPRSEYLSVLQIDSNAKATLTVQTNQGSKVLFDANLSPSPNDVLTAVFSKSTVTVRADPSLRFDLVVKILKGARQALNTCFNVEA